jgi:hypothetical protein
MNDRHTMEERELLDLLKEYPVPEAEAGFYDRAVVRAVHKGSIAAGLAIWAITAMLMTTPQLPDAEPTIPGVTIAMEQEHTVRLVFASAEALDSATLTVSLPEGIELAGFPGQREITWETSLQEGKNLLPLTLIALTPAGGELLARLEHKDRNRTFRLRVDVS